MSGGGLCKQSRDHRIERERLIFFCRADSAFALELLLSSRIIAEGAACPAQDTREERRPNYAQHEDESVSIPSPLPSISFVVARVRDTQTVALAELRALATPELLPPRGLAAPLNREAGRMERRRREPSSASEPT